MRGDQHPKHAALRAARERAIDQLSTGFARDELGLEEFDERLSRAYAAEDEAQLGALVGDLSADALAVVSTPSTSALAPLASPRSPRAVAILGSVERRGQLAARASGALAVLGSVVIDLRDVELPPGVTTLEVSAVLGSVEVIVPPWLAVESEGQGVLGSFESVQRMPRFADPELPVLRITGRAVLGSIEVRTELPAERRALAARKA